MAARDSALILFRNLGNEGLGGEHQCSDGASIGQSRMHDLGRIEHTSFDQISIFIRRSIEAEVRLLRIGHFTKHNRTLFTGILSEI
jgi:hypothetical protein